MSKTAEKVVKSDKSQLYKKFVGIYNSMGNVVIVNDQTQIKVTQNRPISADFASSAPAGDKDQVEIIVTKIEKGHLLGYIQKVLSRSIENNVGIVEYKNGNYYLFPLGKKFGTNILIAPGALNGAIDGSYVTFICDEKDAWNKPMVFVKEVFGHKNDANAFVKGIAMKYGMPVEFSEKTKAEAEKVPTEISEKELEGRLDLRGRLTIAIDGEDTKDRDDAVRLEIMPNGNFKLGVDIADVSHYVKENSAIDADAKLRGTSVYAGGQVIPMLPKRLSNGICSLNEKVDRLTISCTMEIDHGGNVRNFWIEESVINCNYNITYDEVMKIFEGDIETRNKYFDILEMLENMRELAKILQNRSERKGYIEFKSKEAKLVVDNEGKLTDILPRKINEATKIIQSFMITANQTVAKALEDASCPCIFRIHDIPDELKVETLIEVLNELGYNSDYADNLDLSKMFQEITKQIAGRQDEDYLMELLKRTQKKAKYSDCNSGHFGIGEEYYCHFTSPIRRYPDLDVHRSIKAMNHKDEEKLFEYEAKFGRDAMSSSGAEVKAEKVEREVEKMYKCLYMKEHIGEVYEAKISNVVRNGLFVELANTVEGFVPFESPSDYNFDDTKLTITLRSNGMKYRLGEKVMVEAVSANELAQTIDFKLLSKV